MSNNLHAFALYVYTSHCELILTSPSTPLSFCWVYLCSNYPYVDWSWNNTVCTVKQEFSIETVKRTSCFCDQCNTLSYELACHLQLSHSCGISQSYECSHPHWRSWWWSRSGEKIPGWGCRTGHDPVERTQVCAVRQRAIFWSVTEAQQLALYYEDNCSFRLVLQVSGWNPSLPLQCSHSGRDLHTGGIYEKVLSKTPLSVKQQKLF